LKDFIKHLNSPSLCAEKNKRIEIISDLPTPKKNGQVYKTGTVFVFQLLACTGNFNAVKSSVLTGVSATFSWAVADFQASRL
jgi:hypothetical protein